MTNGPRCSYCQEPVRPNSRFTWTRVQGWHRPGKAGGSDVVLRESVDEWACPRCISRIRLGVNPDQQALM
jgi:hypothetical protein